MKCIDENKMKMFWIDKIQSELIKLMSLEMIQSEVISLCSEARSHLASCFS